MRRENLSLAEDVFESLRAGKSSHEIAKYLDTTIEEIQIEEAKIFADQGATLINTPPEHFFAHYFIAQAAALETLVGIMTNDKVASRDRISAAKAYSSIWSDIVRQGRELNVLTIVDRGGESNVYANLSSDELKIKMIEVMNKIQALAEDNLTLEQLSLGPIHRK